MSTDKSIFEKAGDVVRLSQAMGEFTLPDPKRGVLLLSAGSGITPMMAMLQDWAGRAERPDVVLVHSCRHASDWIFREELQTLVHQWPGLRLHPRFTAADARLRSERAFRESDLRNHLINEVAIDDKQLESDKQDDPRFKASAEELKAQGITDFQLPYAIQTLRRSVPAAVARRP